MALDPVLSVGDISTTSATKQYDLGAEVIIYNETYGRQVYRYIQNTSGAAIGAYLGVMQENGTAVYNGILSGADCAFTRFLGVRQAGSLADTYFGWVLKNGYGLCTSNGTTGANAGQKAVASGRFDDGTLGSQELVVHACAAQAVAGNTFVGMVKGL